MESLVTYFFGVILAQKATSPAMLRFLRAYIYNECPEHIYYWHKRLPHLVRSPAMLRFLRAYIYNEGPEHPGPERQTQSELIK